MSEVAHQIEHLADHLRVKRARRLVEEHDLGCHGERAHNGDALLLPAGEHRGIFVRLVGKADALEQRHGLRVGVRLRFEPQLHGGEGDVLLHRHVREEVEMLKDHAHLAAVEIQIDLFAVEGNVLEGNGAGGRLLQEIEAAQQRRFAAAGGADDRHDLALLYAQIAVGERVDAAAAIFLADVLHANEISACHHDAFSFPVPRSPFRRGR